MFVSLCGTLAVAVYGIPTEPPSSLLAVDTQRYDIHLQRVYSPIWEIKTVHKPAHRKVTKIQSLT